MQLTGRISITALAAIVTALSGFSGFTGSAAAEPRDLTSPEAYRAMQFVYQGKTRAAVDYLDSLGVACAGEPFYLLIKARVARELLTVDDESKERIKSDTEPIHRDLDHVIELCGDRMKAAEDAGSDADPRLRLYRGLAWMSKSHLSSFVRKFWRAGRDAKKGKSDLEDYLETNPGDPLALGTLGVFLYFADTIPTVFKYVSKLLFMPTGDREKGLQYLRIASVERSVLQTEFEVVLYSIYILFEGRYEDGLDGTLDVLERYPNKPRLASPLALMQPFNPFGAADNAFRIDAMIERFKHAEAGEAERYELTLLDFLSAHADRLIAPPDVAMAELNRIADADPGHPDWVGGYAAFELGRLQASQGRAAEAKESFAWVRHNDKVSYVHGIASKMTKALGDEGAPDSAEPGWITEIYFGSDGARLGAAAELKSVASPTVETLFYLGEALLLAGDMDGALAAYDGVLETKAALWDEEFQMLAASRAAEIHGARGDYKSAAQRLDRAMEYYRQEFLVDWILEARKRYYERLKDGELEGKPRLFNRGR
jgi:tetratricopeptide (TPR) repeat protein